MEIPTPLMGKLVRKLDGTWKASHCAVCGGEMWTVLNHVWQLTEYRGTGSAPRGQVIPLLVAQCDHCGNMRIGNAITLGVIDGQTGRLSEVKGDG